MPNESAQETLNRILQGLKSDDTVEQLAAIHELETINFNSEAIVLQLEQLALQGRGAVQKFALSALSLTNSRFVASKLSPLTKDIRKTFLKEIERWQEADLIDSDQAAVIKHRYDFDLKPEIAAKPVTMKPVEVDAKPARPAAPTPVPAPQPETPKPITPPRPAEPRPTLAQILLSETSIRIYLYLGAFFVIASAAILAALVQAARLPILLVATFAFATGAIAFKKRLPQPSFAFAIVFSFLLPIDASVIADLLKFSVQGNHAYWSVIFMIMAIIWAFGIWFYESRLFSLASFSVFTLAALQFEFIFNVRNDWIPTFIGFSGLIGLLGVRFLKTWRSQQFALPLFITAQVFQFIVLMISLWLILSNVFNGTTLANQWLAHSLTWLFAASFFALSNLLIPILFFPWLAVASLFLLPWLFPSTFSATSAEFIAAFGLWGALITLASEFAHRMQHAETKKYHYPLLVISLPLFIVSILWGFIEKVSYGFFALLLTGLAYTVIHTLRPRWYVWMAALLAGLGAYFTFFALPFMQKPNVDFSYQLLGASLLLLVPELFFKKPLTFARTWNWPPVVLGIITTFYSLLFVHAGLFEGGIHNAHAAIILGVYTPLFAAYALRFKQPLFGYLSTAALALSILYALTYFKLDLWLPALITLAVIYYLAGYLLARKDQFKAWIWMFIISGLTLGALISVVAVAMLKPTGGWCILAIAALFAIELFTRRNSNLELFIESLLSFSLVIILNDFKVNELAYYFFGTSLLWLGCDGFFKRSFAERKTGLFTQLLTALITLAAVIVIINYRLASAPAALCFAVYTVFFAAYALTYGNAWLGYLSTASAAVTMYYALDYFKITAWLPIFTGLTLIYYVVGSLLRKRTPAWAAMFRHSGLALGSLVSLVALLANNESTSGWYVVVIGVLYVIETVTSQNGWFEAGAHILFSIAAFLILIGFHINADSYILLAISLVWLGGDVFFARTLPGRKLETPVRLVGTAITAFNAWSLLLPSSLAKEAAICFTIYTVFFAIYTWLYNKPVLGYAFTASLPLAVFFTFRANDINGWLFALITIAALYYATGYFLRRMDKAKAWDMMSLISGLGLGTIVAIASPFQIGGIENALPIAIAATLFAVEAFARRNVWLAFPANGLYLIAYFTVLVELNVDEPQYFSMGAALLGMVMNYLLARAGSKTGAFLMGMLSQLILLGTTYIQMISTSRSGFFFILFTQSLVVLLYGIFLRSRSLVIAPISFAVLGVITVLYSALKNLSLVVIIGITGITLLALGILAVLMRERITTLAEKFSDWNA